MTEITQGAIDAKGTEEDALFEREKKVKASVRSGRSLGQKTLAKTIA